MKVSEGFARCILLPVLVKNLLDCGGDAECKYVVVSTVSGGGN